MWKVMKMQKLLKVKNIKKYVENGKKNKWPKPCNKCKMCGHYKKIIHYGFYSRHYINCHLGINEKIYVKRYYCKNCEKTISLLPEFCIKKYILSFGDILNILTGKQKMSLEEYILKLNEKYTYLNLSKQQYYNYLRRLKKNIHLIESFLRIINVKIRFEGNKETLKERVMSLLKSIKIEFQGLDNFLYTFFEKTNKTPLSL
jgi:hypothetical protein